MPPNASPTTSPQGESRDPSGLLIVDKPVGPTSHDVVGMARKAVGIRRIGHTGTLDPMASGVLILCVGKATRIAEYMTGHDKRYLATVSFGTATDTYDATGEVTATSDVRPDRAALERALDAFSGTILQRPPAYSALHTGGQRAHKLARAGAVVDLAPREVKVRSIEIVSSNPEHAVLDIECSTGTYVRSIANDLGPALGTFAHLGALRRTACGRFDETQATPPDALADGGWKSALRPLLDGLSDWPKCTVDAGLALLVVTGRPLPGGAAMADGPTDERPPRIQVLGDDHTLLALMRFNPADDTYRPIKVFTTKDDIVSGDGR